MPDGNAAAWTSRAREGTITNALSIDVEDYFQVEAFAGLIARESWENFPRRVEANVERILALLDAADVRATFFTLGWVAERAPALVRRIVEGGHELASHGYGHARADRQDAAVFRADIARARKLLEDIGGVAVRGYRAPTFSIGRTNPWAFDALAEEGYAYSSSIYPIRHDLYGMAEAPRFPFHPSQSGASQSGLWEIPMTTLRLFGQNLPCAGGGYFRLLPYPIFRTALRQFSKTERQPAVFYFHPWEVDPGQPRVAGCGRMARFRHYVNLSATAGRIASLLDDFAWGRMDEVFAHLFKA